MIDWTKPLELMDGTPVVPYYVDRGAGWPDEAGQYHVADVKERLIGFFNEDGSLYPYSGVSEDTKLRVRNRDEPSLMDQVEASCISMREAIAKFNALTETPTKTLRDEFAMAALTGLIIGDKVHGPVSIVDDAFSLADAMMAARNV